MGMLLISGGNFIGNNSVGVGAVDFRVAVTGQNDLEHRTLSEEPELSSFTDVIHRAGAFFTSFDIRTSFQFVNAVEDAAWDADGEYCQIADSFVLDAARDVDHHALMQFDLGAVERHRPLAVDHVVELIRVGVILQLGVVNLEVMGLGRRAVFSGSTHEAVVRAEHDDCLVGDATLIQHDEGAAVHDRAVCGQDTGLIFPIRIRSQSACGTPAS